MRILGIDPGSNVTGYGLVNAVGNRQEYVASGCIRTGGGELPERLGKIQAGLDEVIRLYCPEQAAIEKVFVYRSADSALKLGQARGAAILTATVRAALQVEARRPDLKIAMELVLEELGHLLDEGDENGEMGGGGFGGGPSYDDGLYSL